MASVLLEAECVTVLRRVAAAQPRDQAPTFLDERLAALDRVLANVSLKNLDDEVLERLRRTPALADCRTLDAIHLATALLFQDQSDTPLMLCTLDERMCQTAGALGFQVRPG